MFSTLACHLWYTCTVVVLLLPLPLSSLFCTFTFTCTALATVVHYKIRVSDTWRITASNSIILFGHAFWTRCAQSSSILPFQLFSCQQIDRYSCSSIEKCLTIMFVD
jgi:hypothetical protein